MRLSPKPIMFALVFFVAVSAVAGEVVCPPTGTREELHYSWRLRGPLSWVAGVAFPTSGTGWMRTVEAKSNLLDTELRISSADRRDGFYMYHSQIDQEGARTVMTYHGYAFRDKRRSERTLFDYVRRLAHIRKENAERVENRDKPIPHDSIRDVLTGIYYLRQNANQITAPLTSEIYSEGKLYPVVFRPAATESLWLKGEQIRTRRFEITAAPGIKKKWPGGVRVWLSDDQNHTPVRIEIKRDLASLQLDLESIQACTE